MKKTNKTNKTKIVAKISVGWQMILLGAQGLASYHLYHSVSGKPAFGLRDYVVIVAATALGVNVAVRVAQLLAGEKTPIES